MKALIRKDLPIIGIILIPIFYLAYLWNELPEKVPVHWNIRGEIDRYGDKSELLYIALLPIFIYLLFLVIPKIDPKNKLNKMGKKYQSIKFILITFMSVLAMYITYIAKHEAVTNANNIMVIVGVLFIILGNYFKTIQANYFIGIKTPWTLENETVWKDTHELGGKIWFGGGLIIVLTSFILSAELNFLISFIIIGILVIVPIVYSYIRFMQLKKSS